MHVFLHMLKGRSGLPKYSKNSLIHSLISHPGTAAQCLGQPAELFHLNRVFNLSLFLDLLKGKL